MKKRIITVCLIGIILLADGAFAQLSERVPDVLPGTIPEMRNPSFRIERMKKPDELILTVPQIQYKNEKGNQLIIARCCIGDVSMTAYFLKSKVTFLELK